MYCDTTHTLPHSVICTVIWLSTLCPSGIFHQHWLTSEGSWWGVKSWPLSRYHDHGEDGGKVDETGQHLCQWGWWGWDHRPEMNLVQQTLNTTVMVGLVRKQFSVGLVASLRCWPRPPGRNFHFWLQSWDEIATLYCQS